MLVAARYCSSPIGNARYCPLLLVSRPALSTDRLCKLSEDGTAVTEECFQRTPLDFVGTQTEIRYTDASKPAVKIPAVTTSAGTYPKGSMCVPRPTPRPRAQ